MKKAKEETPKKGKSVADGNRENKKRIEKKKK